MSMMNLPRPGQRVTIIYTHGAQVSGGVTVSSIGGMGVPYCEIMTDSGRLERYSPAIPGVIATLHVMY